MNKVIVHSARFNCKLHMYLKEKALQIDPSNDTKLIQIQFHSYLNRFYIICIGTQLATEDFTFT